MPPQPPKTDDPLAIGEVVESPDGASYRAIRRIGVGGYSVVYEVVEEKSGQRFAMKVLQLARSNDRVSMERARREGPVLFRLKHPNVVRAHAYGVRNDGMIWLVLDLFVGRTLRELQIAMDGKIPVPLLLEIVAQVCAGLTAIHNLNLVHRDIKPENIHVDQGGELVRLFDLGVVKGDPNALKTTGGFTVGTVAYMSPEQVLATDDVDARSDIFSIGILLYELLTGIHPFCSGDIGSAFKQEIGQKILYAEPEPIHVLAPYVPKTLQQIVTRCLRKDKTERYASSPILARLLAATTKDYLTTQPSVSLKEIMAYLDRQARASGDVPALDASPNPFLWSSNAPRRAADPASAGVAPEPAAREPATLPELEPPSASAKDPEPPSTTAPRVKPAAAPLRALKAPIQAPARTAARASVPLPSAPRARPAARAGSAAPPASKARLGRRAALVVVVTAALVLIVGGTVFSFARRQRAETQEAAPVLTSAPLPSPPSVPTLRPSAIADATATPLRSAEALSPASSATAAAASPPSSAAALPKPRAAASANAQAPAIHLPF